MNTVLRLVALSVLAIGVGVAAGTASGDTAGTALLARYDAAGNEAGLERVELNLQGTNRTVFIHVPAAARRGPPVAAVFVFHGGLGDGPKAARMSGMAAAADRRGFIAVFPNGGRDGSEPWNDGRQTTESDKDDVAFVRAIIDRLVKDYNVDPHRVFATGASSGGMFVYRLACEATDSFAAFAPVIANLPVHFAPHCKPSKPAPILAINGTDDPLMPWSGGEIKHMRWLGIGEGGTVESTPQTIDFWVHANGCDVKPAVDRLPDRVDDGTSIVRYDYSGCRGHADVILYEVKGGGHTWPGTVMQTRTRITGVISRQIDATDVILHFFAQYGL